MIDHRIGRSGPMPAKKHLALWTKFEQVPEGALTKFGQFAAWDEADSARRYLQQRARREGLRAVTSINREIPRRHEPVKFVLYVKKEQAAA